MEQKKTLGTILCILFGLEVLGFIFAYVVNTFGLYNKIVTFTFWIVMDLSKCGMMIYAACKKSLFTHKGLSYAAYFVSFIYLLYVLNQIYFIFAEKGLFAFMGYYASPIMNAIWLIPILLVYWGFKTWWPTKVLATIAGIFYFIQSLGWIKIRALYDSFDKTQDYDILEKASSISDTFEIIGHLGSLCCFVALILTIIWMNKRSITPSALHNPIDLI